MAQFLGCDRSALSRVLSQLKAEGVIEYRKSEFVVKE
jgi:CRP-like cAMP-binding protein